MSLLAAGLTLGFSPSVSAQTADDISVRDQLIADQENLLNAYRCLFNTDTELVAGGCADPVIITPGPPPAQPTLQDLAVRDQLIADQEALLNVYRCQFNVDTQLVTEGCPHQPTDDSNDERIVPWNANFVDDWELMTHLANTCNIQDPPEDGRLPTPNTALILVNSDLLLGGLLTCDNPSDTHQLLLIATSLYRCNNVQDPQYEGAFTLPDHRRTLVCDTSTAPHYNEFVTLTNNNNFAWRTDTASGGIEHACPIPDESSHWWPWHSDNTLQLCYRIDHPNNPHHSNWAASR